MAAGVVTAYLGYQSFVTNLTNFLDVLLVMFIPWSAVNLADYFLVRRGPYDVASFFTADGAYGRFAWRGLLAYAIGLAAEWPFVAQPDYTGPLVRTLGGADISWLVGWFAAAIVYLLLVAVDTRHRPPRPAHRRDRPIVPARISVLASRRYHAGRGQRLCRGQGLRVRGGAAMGGSPRPFDWCRTRGGRRLPGHRPAAQARRWQIGRAR